MIPLILVVPVVVQGLRIGLPLLVRYAPRIVSAVRASRATRLAVEVPRYATWAARSPVGKMVTRKLPSGVSIPVSAGVMGGVSALQEADKYGWSWEAISTQWNLEGVLMDAAVGGAMTSLMVLKPLQGSFAKEFGLLVATSTGGAMIRSKLFTGEWYHPSVVRNSQTQAPLVWFRKELMRFGGQVLFGDANIASSPLGLVFNASASFLAELVMRGQTGVSAQGVEATMQCVYQGFDAPMGPISATDQTALTRALSMVGFDPINRELGIFLREQADWRGPHSEVMANASIDGSMDEALVRAFQAWLKQTNDFVEINGVFDETMLLALFLASKPAVDPHSWKQEGGNWVGPLYQHAGRVEPPKLENCVEVPPGHRIEMKHGLLGKRGRIVPPPK